MTSLCTSSSGHCALLWSSPIIWENVKSWGEIQVEWPWGWWHWPPARTCAPPPLPRLFLQRQKVPKAEGQAWDWEPARRCGQTGILFSQGPRSNGRSRCPLPAINSAHIMKKHCHCVMPHISCFSQFIVTLWPRGEDGGGRCRQTCAALSIRLLSLARKTARCWSWEEVAVVLCWERLSLGQCVAGETMWGPAQFFAVLQLLWRTFVVESLFFCISTHLPSQGREAEEEHLGFVKI